MEEGGRGGSRPAQGDGRLSPEEEGRRARHSPSLEDYGKAGKELLILVTAVRMLMMGVSG